MRQVYFGNYNYATWVACPATGIAREKVRYSETLEYENGTADVIASPQYHQRLELEFPVQDAAQAGGIEAWRRFYNGDTPAQVGANQVYQLFDPMWSNYNLFPPNYATPGLAGNGWRNWGSRNSLGYPSFNDTTYATVTANVYDKPGTAVIWDITATANVPQGLEKEFIIPPGYNLYVGATGSTSGTARLHITNPSGTLISSVPLVSDTANPVSSYATVSGNTYKAVRVGISRTSTASSSIRLVSMWAQILPIGTSPSVPRHLTGEGAYSYKFDGPVASETYVMADRHLVGMSAALIEVS